MTSPPIHGWHGSPETAHMRPYGSSLSVQFPGQFFQLCFCHWRDQDMIRIKLPDTISSDFSNKTLIREHPRQHGQEKHSHILLSRHKRLLSPLYRFSAEASASRISFFEKVQTEIYRL